MKSLTYQLYITCQEIGILSVFDLGLDNEWSPFEHSSSFWHISVCHDLCPRLVCFVFSCGAMRVETPSINAGFPKFVRILSITYAKYISCSCCVTLSKRETCSSPVQIKLVREMVMLQLGEPFYFDVKEQNGSYSKFYLLLSNSPFSNFSNYTHLNLDKYVRP